MNLYSTRLLQLSLFIACITFIADTSQAKPPEDIRAELVKLVGQRGLTSKIIESAMPGVYQVDLGDRVVFMSKTDDHILLGDVFDTKRLVSLGEEIKQQKSLAIINDIPESEMIVFKPQQTLRTISIFTDIDCSYCRKLHEEVVPALLAKGVKVRYLWYPRSGIGTPSYDKAVSVWCAEDQTTAMDMAKLNNQISPVKCDPNPVASQYTSGQRIGVRGTPTIVVDDGTIIGGYLPAKNLLVNLGLESEASLTKANKQ